MLRVKCCQFGKVFGLLLEEDKWLFSKDEKLYPLCKKCWRWTSLGDIIPLPLAYEEEWQNE